MKDYRVTITGVSPLLMHRDNHNFGASLKAWQSNPENVPKAVKGDDRMPGWSWIGGIYEDGKHLGIPSDNLMTMFREGGTKVPTGGKGGKTYKQQTQSGIMVMETLWPLETNTGKRVPWLAIKELSTEEDFDVHVEVVRELGFDLMVKRAKIGQAKHVRVRAIFDAGWSIAGRITVMDDTLKKPVLQSILDCAGLYCGLGDWRPSSPRSPGPYGRFESEIEAL